MKCGRKPTGRIQLPITITLPPHIINAIDEQRGKIPRSRFIAGILSDYLKNDTAQATPQLDTVNKNGY